MNSLTLTQPKFAIGQTVSDRVWLRHGEILNDTEAAGDPNCIPVIHIGIITGLWLDAGQTDTWEYQTYWHTQIINDQRHPVGLVDTANESALSVI
jgi:hypothetical protein